MLWVYKYSTAPFPCKVHPKSIHANQVSWRGWRMKWKALNYHDINILLVSWATVTLDLLMGQGKSPHTPRELLQPLVTPVTLPFKTTTHPLCTLPPAWLYLFPKQLKCPVFEQAHCPTITPCVNLKQTQPHKYKRLYGLYYFRWKVILLRLGRAIELLSYARKFQVSWGVNKPW